VCDNIKWRHRVRDFVMMVRYINFHLPVVIIIIKVATRCFCCCNCCSSNCGSDCRIYAPCHCSCNPEAVISAVTAIQCTYVGVFLMQGMCLISYVALFLVSILSLQLVRETMQTQTDEAMSWCCVYVTCVWSSYFLVVRYVYAHLVIITALLSFNCNQF